MIQKLEYYDDNDYIHLWNAYLEGDLSGFYGKQQQQLKNHQIYKNIDVTFPMPKMLTEKIAKLVFSEVPKITVNTKYQERFDYIFKQNNIIEKLQHATQFQSGLGECYLKISIDLDNYDYPIISNVFTLDAYPTKFMWNEVTQAVFYKVLTDNNITDNFWLKEKHFTEKGKKYIHNVLLKGSALESAQHVPLSTIDETTDLEELIELKTIKNWFIHVKNPQLNTLQPYSKRGISIFSNVLEMIDMLNLTMQSEFKDVQLKQPKIFIDEDMLSTVRDSTTGRIINRKYDLASDLVVKLDGKDNGKDLITPLDMPISIEYSTSIFEQINRIYEAVGLSVRRKSAAAKNELEIETENKDTFELKHAFENVWKIKLNYLISVIMEIDVIYFNQMTTNDNEITIEFRDTIKNDYEKRSAVALAEFQAGLLSKETTLSILYPDWQDKRIQDELNKINGERENEVEIDFMGQEGKQEEPEEVKEEEKEEVKEVENGK